MTTTAPIAGSTPSPQQIDQLVLTFTNRPRPAFEAAAAAFDAAFPHDYAAQNLLGALHAQLKDFARAEAAFAKALAARPDAADTLFVHGITLYELGRHADAIAVLARVNELAPENTEATFYRALCHHLLGQSAAAADLLQPLCASEPGNLRARNSLGLALLELGRSEEAAAEFEHVLARDPRHLDARLNLALKLERGDAAARAAEVIRAGIALAPNSADLHERLGALLLQSDPAGAEAAYRRTLALDPGAVNALNNLGLILFRRREFGEALDCFAIALRARPEMAPLHGNISFVLQQIGALDDALAALERALELDPDQPFLRGQKLLQQMQLCDWRALDEYAQVADTLGITGEAISPGGIIAMDDDPARQRARAEVYAARYAAIVPALFAPRAAGERIRVGYFSADFHDHATMHLMSGLFRCHDRSRFEISVWSYGLTREGAQREALKAHVDRFIDIADLPDAAVVDLAREAGLDIAVDLKGYTQDNRFSLFAHRLAPVQIGHLGYPGTSGAPFLDYFIADAVTIPAEERAHFIEQVIRLPGSYQPNDDTRAIAPETPAREELGLPEDGFVFACFNNAYKITPREWDIWMRLLEAVPGSVLWLFKSNDWAQDALRRAAEARGVDPARLVFAPWAPPAAHLARLRAADLFLDCFACNAHTTASDALWAGLPVLTRPGRSFIARVAASLVTAVGLPELVAANDAAYEALALDLARSPGRLADLRARLAENRKTAPLFDSAGYARALEQAYAAVHRRRVEGLAPADIDLN